MVCFFEKLRSGLLPLVATQPNNGEGGFGLLMCIHNYPVRLCIYGNT